MAEKMTAAEIIYAALVWGEEGMLSMIGGLDDSDPYKAEVSDQWKRRCYTLHTYHNSYGEDAQ